MTNAFDDLRRQIRDIDQEILRLAARRLDVAKEIGKRKLESGTPVRDYVAEREVLSRFDTLCADLDLDPTMGKAIARALIGGAVRTQEELHESTFEGTKQRISIVGGRGHMGAWLARYLHSRGHRVTIHDPAGRLDGFHNARSLETAVRDAEIVVLAVPLHLAPQVYGTLLDLRPAGVMVDIFSLKSPVLEQIARARDRGLSVTSCHPLFGPDVYLLSEHTLLLCPCGDVSADGAVEALFTGTSLDLVNVPVADHDRMMGIVLGLGHAINIIFTEALARSGMTSEQLDRVATTTYLKQATTAAEVARENPRLYYDIQHLNEHSREIYGLIDGALTAFRGAALHDKPGAFEALMHRGREYFE